MVRSILTELIPTQHYTQKKKKKKKRKWEELQYYIFKEEK